MPIDLSQLNPEQQSAIKYIEGPSMVIAGAGSGKTRVLTYKIRHLIESGVNPYEILALTFTNKAAGEIKERVINLTGNISERIWMGTFHSVFARILRIEAEHLGFSREFSIYDNDDSISVIKKITDYNEVNKKEPTPSSIYNLISRLKNKFILQEEFATLAKTPFERKVGDVYREYQKQLIRSNAMDFDDLLINPIMLFRRIPEVLRKYQNRFKFILIDEYQDTNRAQYIVLKELSEIHRNITVVGDDAQSIYRWRGAEIENIFSFREDFKEHKIFRLEQNYRSTRKILALADDIIKKNKRQINKNLWTSNSEGDCISLIETMTDREEAIMVARQIKDEIRTRKINFSDIAVLYRTNAQSRTIEEALRNSGLRYIIIGGIKFYQRKEIKDILCHLKIIVNPADENSLLRAINLREGVGKVTVDRLIESARKENLRLFEIITSEYHLNELRGSARNALIRLLELINKYRTLKKEIKLVEFVKGVIDEIGIMSNLKSENSPEAFERINNIEEFISAVAQFSDANPKATLEDFLEQVALVSDTDDIDDKKNYVTLMTVHSAKGLEFKVVFITGMEENLFPVSLSLGSEEDLEEERRLFYVAVTRAKEKLYISFSNQRYRFGKNSYQIKSKFIKEISAKNSSENIIFEKFSLNKTLGKESFPQTILDKKRSISSKKSGKKGITKIEYFEDENDVFSDIRKGVKIFHENFGNGKVLSTTGNGKGKKAEIYFEDYGVKMIILKYAKIRVNN